MVAANVAQGYEARYEEGLSRYEQGAPVAELIPHFLTLRQEAFDVRVAVALGWLYILSGDRERALRYCKEAKAVPQGRYNHALALLTFNEKGVRQKLDEAYQLGGEEARLDAIENLKDAIARKGGVYPAAQKMLGWLTVS